MNETEFICGGMGLCLVVEVTGREVSKMIPRANVRMMILLIEMGKKEKEFYLRR